MYFFQCEKELITAFFKWNENHGANNGRLYYKGGGGRTGAWSSKENIKGQWLEVDLGETTKVTMVATQGRYDTDQWVQSYKVSYSKYGGDFVFQNKVSSKVRTVHEYISNGLCILLQ